MIFPSALGIDQPLFNSGSDRVLPEPALMDSHYYAKSSANGIYVTTNPFELRFGVWARLLARF
jgi:hypothetical protein